jgi:hypothetical protein
MIRVQNKQMVVTKQNQGIFYATVLQTDKSISLGDGSPIPTGSMTVLIPSLNTTQVYGPMPYPGKIAPPLGSQCSVGFDAHGNPVALALYGAPLGATGSFDLAPLTEDGTEGSVTFVDGLITEFTAPT